MQKEYWVCMIGPAAKDKLPAGGDFPMRRAVQQAFSDLVGDDEQVCYSGWGYSEKQVEAMRKGALTQEE